jgi:hypothetical protein
MQFIDWYIAAHVGIAELALLTLAFLHPDPGIVAAVCAAVPTILGLYHWFVLRDAKQQDAPCSPSSN